MSTQNRRQQHIRGTTAEWAANDVVLLAGEIGIDTSSNRFKIGNGTSKWSELSFVEGGGGGGSTDSFGTVAVSGQTSIVADQANETLTFVAGTNIGITTSAPAGSVTIATSGLGTAATKDTGTGAGNVILGNDARLTDARTPSAHTTSHKHGGSDEVATATPAANVIPKAGAAGTLATGFIPDLSATYAVAAKGVTNGDSHDHSGGDGAAIPDTVIILTDEATQNSTTGRHGFLKKLSNSASDYMDGTGNWSTPTGGSASNSFSTISCPTGTNPAADSSTDTLNLTVTGPGIVIAGNSSTDTIDFSLSSIPETAFGLTDEESTNATTGRHGFLRKLSSVATQYMDGTGAWSTPAGTTNNITSVANRAALDDLSSTTYQTAIMRGRDTSGDNGFGIFDWNGASQYIGVAADSQQGIYVPPSGGDGSTGAWIRRYPPGQVNPAWFGTTYSDVEWQAAMDRMSPGDALVIDPNTVWTFDVGVTSNGADNIAIVCLAGRGDTMPKIKAGATGITLLTLPNYGVRVYAITFAGTDSEVAGYDSAYGTCIGIAFDRSSLGSSAGYANLDVEVRECGFIAFQKGIYAKGRNVLVADSLFTGCQYGIQGAIYTYSGNKTVTRGYRIMRNRFHGNGAPNVNLDSTADTACIDMPIDNNVVESDDVCVTNIEVRDNNADRCCDFYHGTLNNTFITGNQFYIAHGPMVYCDASTYTPHPGTIDGNHWWGYADGGSGAEAVENADYWVYAKNIGNLRIGSNYAYMCAKSLIKLVDCYKIHISDCTLAYANISQARSGVGGCPAIDLDVLADADFYGASIDGCHIYPHPTSSPVSYQYNYAVYATGGGEYVTISGGRLCAGSSGIVGSADNMPKYMFFDDDGNIETNALIKLNDSQMAYDETPAADQSGGAIEIISNYVAGENLTKNNIVYLKSDGKWWKANATDYNKVGFIGLAMETKSADAAVKVMRRGIWRVDGWNVGAGAPIYVSKTDGAVETSLTGYTTGNIVQFIGYGLTYDSGGGTKGDGMFFCPDSSYKTV